MWIISGINLKQSFNINKKSIKLDFFFKTLLIYFDKVKY